MDYKKDLLLFLYENNSGLVEIYPVSENTTVTNGEIKQTIIALKKDGLIDTDESFRRIGTGDPSRLETVKSLHIKARITTYGEKYIRVTYMKKNETNTFNIDQLVNIGGDNHAPISQTKDHSLSAISNNAATIKNKQPIIKRVIKFVFWFVGGIVSLYSLYELIKALIKLITKT